MGKQYSRIRIDSSQADDLANKFRKQFPEIFEQEYKKMVEEVVKFGELEMKSNISASGTAFSQKARQAGINKGPGRYRTGEMYNAVRSRVDQGAKTIQGAFGWLTGFKDYFGYQEEGFKNRFIANYGPSGNLITSNGKPSIRRNPFGGYKNTKGMFAYRDAIKTVNDEMPRFERKYNGIIKRRIGAIKS